MSGHPPEPEPEGGGTGYAVVKYGIILIIVIVVLFFVARYLIPLIRDFGEDDREPRPAPTGAAIAIAAMTLSARG